MELETYIVTTEFTVGSYSKTIQSSLHLCIIFPSYVKLYHLKEGRRNKDRKKEEMIQIPSVK